MYAFDGWREQNAAEHRVQKLHSVEESKIQVRESKTRSGQSPHRAVKFEVATFGPTIIRRFSCWGLGQGHESCLVSSQVYPPSMSLNSIHVVNNFYEVAFSTCKFLQ